MSELDVTACRQIHIFMDNFVKGLRKSPHWQDATEEELDNAYESLERYFVFKLGSKYVDMISSGRGGRALPSIYLAISMSLGISVYTITYLWHTFVLFPFVLSFDLCISIPLNIFS